MDTLWEFFCVVILCIKPHRTVPCVVVIYSSSLNEIQRGKKREREGGGGKSMEITTQKTREMRKERRLSASKVWIFFFISNFYIVCVCFITAAEKYSNKIFFMVKFTCTWDLNECNDFCVEFQFIITVYWHLCGLHSSMLRFDMRAFDLNNTEYKL